jgi:CubicO group peptidase (beta-lactamase class C family)
MNYKSLSGILFIFLSFQLSAQTTHEREDSVALLVQKHFNANDAKQLYQLTGEQFHKILSEEKFTEISKNNLFPLGQMKAPEYYGTSQGVSKYKIAFESITLSLNLSLDENRKLVTFLINEYVDNSKQKTEKVATNNPLATSLDRQVDSAVQSYMKLAATIGLSIGILKDGKTYFYGYGETTKGNHQVPNENNLFEIGSISKTFTAILLADAVNQGKISLDDPLSKFLPGQHEISFEGVPVTVRMLSNHTSGLPRMPDNFSEGTTDPLNPYKNYSREDLMNFLKTVKLSRKPGTVYEYSNLAVATVGLILEDLYHKSFESLVREKILAPLKMDDTKQFLIKKDSARFASGYNEQGVYNGPWDFKAFAAAGSLRSTSSDMLKYAKANWGEGPASLEKAIALTQKKTFSDANISIGLGWHFIKPGKDEVLFHNGGTGGYRSFLAINREKKFAVVVLSNSAIGTEGIGNKLMSWMENH